MCITQMQIIKRAMLNATAKLNREKAGAGAEYGSRFIELTPLKGRPKSVREAFKIAQKTVHDINDSFDGNGPLYGGVPEYSGNKDYWSINIPFTDKRVHWSGDARTNSGAAARVFIKRLGFALPKSGKWNTPGIDSPALFSNE